MAHFFFFWLGNPIIPVTGIFSRRPVNRSAGSRSNWRKTIVSS